MSRKPDSYAFMTCRYGATCHLCGRSIRAGADVYGSRPGLHNRRKRRWRWICSQDCAGEHGITLAPVGEWARRHREYEVNLEAVRAAQRHMGGE